MTSDGSGPARGGLRTALTYALLLGVKHLSRLLWSHEVEWVGDVPEDPWARVGDIRVVAILNHTSLYEPILAGAAPNAFLKEVARHGVAPIARKTVRRPLVGTFFRLVAGRVVPITRERDRTWEAVLEHADDPRAMVVILPEGRMMRRTGLDAQGNPMTIRGGIADILETVPEGRMLLAYSAGLHHIHAPGDTWPRLFRSIGLRLETVDIPTYRERRRREAEEDGKGFKAAVVEDLTRRRDHHCRPPSPAPS